jgi:outer membrane protein OmpA-like peptidoglycan-associated protein
MFTTHKNLFLYICCLSIFILNSCRTTHYLTGNENLNQSNIARIIDGKSTKYELLSIIGEPDEITVGHTKSSIETLQYNLPLTEIEIVPEGEYTVWYYYVRNRIIINFTKEMYSETKYYFIINDADIVVNKLYIDKTAMEYDDLDKNPNEVTAAETEKEERSARFKKETTIQLDIEFGVGSAEISSRYFDQLKRVADQMKASPNRIAVIEGHTDSMGAATTNLQLSQRRAESVRQNLIDHFGIAQERLVAKGFGETQPIASNETTEGRRKNRRVSVILLGQ